MTGRKLCRRFLQRRPKSSIVNDGVERRKMWERRGVTLSPGSAKGEFRIILHVESHTTYKILLVIYMEYFDFPWSVASATTTAFFSITLLRFHWFSSLIFQNWSITGRNVPISGSLDFSCTESTACRRSPTLGPRNSSECLGSNLVSWRTPLQQASSI